MAGRLILDTGVLVASERARMRLSDVVSHDDDLAIAAITVAELRTGVELASSHHRAARAAFLARVLDTLSVEPYDIDTAARHAVLLAFVHRAGVKRGAHDLIVAATAAATGRTLLTTDRGAMFHELPDVDSILIT